MKYRFNKKTKQYFVPVKAKTFVVIPKEDRKGHRFALSIATLKRLVKAKVLDDLQNKISSCARVLPPGTDPAPWKQ